MATKSKQYVTPAGVASYPHLTDPDTKFDAAGVYSTKMIFTGKEGAKIAKFLDDEYKAAQVQAAAENAKLVEGTRKKAKKVRPGPDPYEEGEDGEIIVNFKMKASGIRKDKTKWSMRPAFFDASGVPIKAGLKIGGGSILKIAYEANLYNVGSVGAGVSCRLNAVQVIDFKPWGERDAEGYGFGEEEGFAADEADENAFTQEQDEDEDGDDENEGDEDEAPEEDEDDEEADF